MSSLVSVEYPELVWGNIYNSVEKE